MSRIRPEKNGTRPPRMFGPDSTDPGREHRGARRADVHVPSAMFCRMLLASVLAPS